MGNFAFITNEAKTFPVQLVRVARKNVILKRFFVAEAIKNHQGALAFERTLLIFTEGARAFLFNREHEPPGAIHLLPTGK